MTLPTLQQRKRSSRTLQIIGLVLIVLLVAIGIGLVIVNRQIDASEIYDATANAPGQFATLSGYQIHYQVLGDPAAARPALLVHGFGVPGSAEWRRLAPLLAQDRPVITVDLLGFGHSERVYDPVPALSHRGQAALLVALLDTLDIPAVDVIGSSYGGGVAAQLALDAPDRVARITFLDGQVFDLGGGFFGVLGGLTLGIGRAISWSFQGASPSAEQIGANFCAQGAFCPEEGDPGWADLRPYAQIMGTADTLTAFSRTPLDARIPAELGAITQPALVIWGDADTIIDPAQAERLAAALPDARLHILPGLWHTPHLEAPEEVYALVSAFLDEPES